MPVRKCQRCGYRKRVFGNVCADCKKAIKERNSFIFLNRRLKLVGKRKCSTCKKIRKLCRFYRYGDQRCSSQCKACVTIATRKYKKDRGFSTTWYYKRNPLSKVFSSAKDRAQKKGIAFSLTMTFLKNLLEQNDHRCAITGIRFDHSRIPFRVSLDRVKPEKGYVVGNVRLVLWGVNAGMNAWGLKTYLEIAKAAIRRRNTC